MTTINTAPSGNQDLPQNTNGQTAAKPTVLLVDDLPTNLNILSFALKDEYELVTAISGSDALALAEANPPDLILLDVMMPEMDGLETLSRLRNSPWGQSIPVILVTVDDRMETQVEGLSLGANDFITKPIVIPVLNARIRNVLARKQNETQLELAASVFAHANEGIVICDGKGTILDVNAAFGRITGYSREEVLGCNPRMLKSGRQNTAFYADMWRSLKDNGSWVGEVWNRRKDGSVYAELLTISTIWGTDGQAKRYIALFTDISAQKIHQQKLEHIASHDTLTGLSNRLSLQIRLNQALLTVRRDATQLAVLFIDLDRFKIINDTFGHHIGDLLLIAVAQRLQHCVRESDIVARLGGDEFVIVLPGVITITDVTSVTEKLLERLAEPYAIDGHILHSSPSIGIGMFPQDGNTIDALMKAADTAMYHAKNNGRNNAQYFNAAMNTAIQAQMAD